MAITGLNELANLSTVIGQGLGLTNGSLVNEIDQSAKKTIRKGARLLRNNSPERTGDYRKGWTTRKVGNRWVLFNRTDYQLTHLLENGHAGKDGNPPINAIPHIRPVEEIVIDEYISEIERILRG